MASAFGEIRSANTILYCRDWAATEAFYREALGLPVAHANSWFVEFELAPHAFLSVADASRCSIEAAGGRGLTITLRVDDADRTHARMTGAGLTVGALRDHPWGARVFYLHDPEGNRIEVWSSSDD